MDFAGFGLGMCAGVMLMIGLVGLAFATKSVERSVDAADVAAELRREVKELRGRVDVLCQTTENMRFKVDTFYAPYNSVPVPCTGAEVTMPKGSCKSTADIMKETTAK